MTLPDFFNKYNKVALCFSGGTDSTLLLHTAAKCGADIKAYFVKTQFQPQHELDDAVKAAKLVGAELEILGIDILSQKNVSENPKNRCYYCKKKILEAIAIKAKKDGYNTIIDGTNASDDASDRPGMKALSELSVLSPLKDCKITKSMVRELSKRNNLFTWNKPSYSCLATRIPTGVEITQDLLSKIDKAETELFKLGYSDFRIRYFYGTARIQFKSDELECALRHCKSIKESISPHFSEILIDLNGR